MKRETLLKRLIRVRELKLRVDANDLKMRANVLAEIENLIEQTRAGAHASLESPEMLAELGALGALRLSTQRRAQDVAKEVALLKQKVWRSRKLTDAARAARAELSKEKLAAEERSSEIEAEHFFGWKNPSDRSKQ